MESVKSASDSSSESRRLLPSHGEGEDEDEEELSSRGALNGETSSGRDTSPGKESVDVLAGNGNDSASLSDTPPPPPTDVSCVIGTPRVYVCRVDVDRREGLAVIPRVGVPAFVRGGVRVGVPAPPLDGKPIPNECPCACAIFNLLVIVKSSSSSPFSPNSNSGSESDSGNGESDDGTVESDVAPGDAPSCARVRSALGEGDGTFRFGFGEGEGERPDRLGEVERLRVRRALGVTGAPLSTPLFSSFTLMDLGEPNPLALDALNMLDAGERSRLDEGERRLDAGRLWGDGERTIGSCGTGDGDGECSMGVCAPFKLRDRTIGDGAFS